MEHPFRALILVSFSAFWGIVLILILMEHPFRVRKASTFTPSVAVS